MQIKELGHVVLYVRDIERSSKFYRDILGFREISHSAYAAAFSSERTHHELLLLAVGMDAKSLPEGRRVGMYHFGLKIGDDDNALRAAIGDLEAADVPILGATDHTVSHSLYIEDPDGNEIELYVDVPGADWKKDRSLVMSPSKPLVL
jgi:catechol-2,3-dioxygenase